MSAVTAKSSGRLRVDLVTLDREVISTECDEVTLPATMGELGILPGHAALVATLGIGVMSVRTGTARRYFALTGGFCEVSRDVVTVLADQAEVPEQIDVAASRAAIETAEKHVKAVQDESWLGYMREIELARARIAVATKG